MRKNCLFSLTTAAFEVITFLLLSSAINLKIYFSEFETVRMLNFKRERFIWDEEKQLFIAINGLDKTDEIQNIMNEPRGLTTHGQKLRYIYFSSKKIYRITIFNYKISGQ